MARFAQTFMDMGAEDVFDYANEDSVFKDRLGRCYELAGRAFISDEVAYVVPAPIWLIHGQWQGPNEPAPIDHAWVLLADDRVWEPISQIIFNPSMFYDYTRGLVHAKYDAVETRMKMLSHGHYGPWPVSGNQKR